MIYLSALIASVELSLVLVSDGTAHFVSVHFVLFWIDFGRMFLIGFHSLLCLLKTFDLRLISCKSQSNNLMLQNFLIKNNLFFLWLRNEIQNMAQILSLLLILVDFGILLFEEEKLNHFYFLIIILHNLYILYSFY